MLVWPFVEKRLVLFQILLIFVLIYSTCCGYFPHQCKCVGFNSTDGGKFHSPDFPNQLEHIDCLFYHFQAPPNYFVQIVFDSFSLPTRNGICTSSLRIYDHSIDGLIDQKDRADYEFCAKELATGRTFYSKREHLLLQVLHNKATSKGFNGEYRFLPKLNFTSDAIEIAECTYRVEKIKGKLFSPLYPYYYPSNINCTYVLPQQRGHQIVITSSFLDLGPDASIEVYEMSDGKHLLQTATSASKTLYAHCGNSVLISFRAGLNDIEKASGFVLEFQYESGAWTRLRGIDGGDSKPECMMEINSTNLKTGTISSEDLGRGSSLPAKCRITLIGFPNEKISVQFTKFNLYVPENKDIEKRCIDADHITVDVRVDARLSRIDEWCGANTPPQLMSSSNLLQVEYTTKSSRAIRESVPEEIGFSLDYKFHTDWNMDHMQARVDKNRACRFIFNSSIHSSGKLWSINYPGLYPRNLYCEYIFHGKDSEIVHIHFEYFDIEGFNQCDESTQSDYILFSNYQTHDRTNRRYCGKIRPRGPILSESNYFRMIFFTNDIFDATGFHAHYQFITQHKNNPAITRVKLTTSSAENFRNFLIFSNSLNFLSVIAIYKLIY